MVNKEISIATVIIAILYSCSFVFSYGYANYYGFPRDIITIDISQLLSSSFEFLLIIISFAALFHARFENDKRNKLCKGLALVLLIVISMLPWYLFAPKGYLMDNGYKHYFLATGILSLVLIYLVNSFSDFFENKYEFKRKMNVFLTLIGLLSAFYITGWLSAFNKPGLYMSSDNKVLLASYSGRDIWGSCINESADYFITKQDEEVKLKRISGRQVDELKTCFNRAG